MIEILRDLLILLVAIYLPICFFNRLRARRHQRKMAEYAYDPNPVHWHSTLRRKSFMARWDSDLALTGQEANQLDVMDSVAFMEREMAFEYRDELRSKQNPDWVDRLRLAYLEESLK